MKRALVVALLILPAVGSAQTRGTPFSCGAEEINDSLSLCQPSPGDGMRLHVTDIMAQSTSATGGTFELYHGTTRQGVPCLSDQTAMVPPNAATRRFVAAGNEAAATKLRFNPPLVAPAGKDICVEGDASEPITLQVVGYIAP